MIERFLEIIGEDIKIVSYAFNHSFLSMESNKGLTLLSFLELREYTEDEKRFMIELEFVQALSNVFYLKCKLLNTSI